jgi:hypothetical protein
MRVASGYLPEQRLINPAMLPIYRLVLKIVLVWVLAPLFAILCVSALFASAHPGRALVAALFEAWRAGFMTMGIVTTIFVLLDRYHISGIDQWDPRKLPRVPVTPETAPRWSNLAGFIFGIIGVLFWFSLMWQRTEFSIPDGPRIILGPVWKYVYWLLPGLTMIGALSDLLGALRPSMTRVRSWVHVGVDACTVVLVGVGLKVDNWVTLSDANFSAGDLAKAASWVNLGLQITLISMALVAVGDAIVEIRRLRRAKPAQSAPILTTL